MEFIIAFLGYLIAVLTLLVVGMNTGSWLREYETGRLVFRAPWTYRLGWGMFALLLLASPLIDMRPVLYNTHKYPPGAPLEPSQWIVMGYFTCTGIFLALLLLYWAGPQELEVDTGERRFYHRRPWPFGFWNRSGSLDDVEGIRVGSNGGIHLVLRRRPRLSVGYPLGNYASLAQGASVAEGFAERMGLRVLPRLPRRR